MLTECAGQFDTGRGGKEALFALLARVAGRMVDHARLRVGQDGRRDAGCVQIVEGILAGRIRAVPRRALEAVHGLAD